MEAIILAGGLGTRLKAVVPDLPKPMAAVNGRPFLEYLLDYWVGQGIGRFILSVGYKREVIEKHFGARYKRAEVAYAVEQRPLGTGGGLLQALKRRREKGPFVAMNGDTFFEVDLQAMLDFHRRHGAEITIALREMEGNARYAGVTLDGQGRIASFDSHARTSGRALINGGVYVVEPAVFDMPAEPAASLSIENELYPRLLSAGRRFFGFLSTGRFIDIGIPEDYRRAATVLTRA